MESVLHIEPINRKIPSSLSIGHTDYIFYGERQLDDEEDNLGTHAAGLRLGCPLNRPEHGSASSHVPLVKTIEYMPDFSRNSGNVYFETLHYFKDRKFLIPIRTKIHSGRSSGLRIAHLPSLNFVRQELTGFADDVNDVRPDIIAGLLENDSYFVDNHRHPVFDWLRYDLANTLATSSVTDIRFDMNRLNQMIHRYKRQVQATPYEVTTRHLKDIANVIGLEQESLPRSYGSEDVICRPILDVKHRMIGHNHDFRSFGNIKLDNLPNIDYNPFNFQSILGLIDRIPLTDFNIDVIVQVDDTISFIHEHVALNRLGVFCDNDLGSYATETLLQPLLNEEVLRSVIKKFVKYHSCIDDETTNLINQEPIKLKLIKTIRDEVLILLYEANSTAKDDPLCGVYFDIALQSLAPLTIVPGDRG